MKLTDEIYKERFSYAKFKANGDELIASEAMEKIWMRISQYTGETDEDFDKWSSAVIHNTIKDNFRKKTTRKTKELKFSQIEYKELSGEIIDLNGFRQQIIDFDTDTSDIENRLSELKFIISDEELNWLLDYYSQVEVKNTNDRTKASRLIQKIKLNISNEKK